MEHLRGFPSRSAFAVIYPTGVPSVAETWAERVGWRLASIAGASHYSLAFRRSGELLRVVNLHGVRMARGRLPPGKRFAAHHGVYGIENRQALDGRDLASGDWIAEILDVARRIRECRPRGQAQSVRITRLGEVDPIAGYLVGQSAISRGPFPGTLVEVVEDIPKLGEVTGAPACIH